MWAHDNNQEPASRWLWQSGRDAWTAFAPNQASALEEAWATGGGVVRIDAERQVRVDTSGVPMRQERVDNPGRSRAVKRENGGAQEGKRPRLTPAAPSATADADGGGGGGVSPAASGPPLAWRLNRLGEQWSRVLPSSVNTDSVSLDELLSAVELQGATQLHLHNFLFDLDFVFETCPALGSFVASGGLVKVFHGDGRPPRSVAATTMPAAVECFEPPTEQFGTMHSKCIVVVRPSRLSVHVITANFIFSDWHNKTNGVWSGSFPRLDAPPPRPAAGTFGLDLLEYYEAVRAIGADKPGSWSSSDQDGAPPRWRALDVSWLSLYDYSGARARLVASVPGTSGATAGRHTGEHIQKWGHMRVRGLLAAEGLAVPLDDSVLALQFSSLSSVGNNDKWLRELVASLCGGSAVMPRLRVVYPTRAQVGASLEGWVAGASIPCQTANAAKLRSVLQQLSGASAFARLCGWDGGPSGRAAAVPHIKSYALYTDEGRLGWAMLTSSNLSQAAWGKLEKGGTQLYIKSYELGVLVLPSLQPAGRQSLVATSAAPLVGEESATLVPLPYTLPPTPYASSDDAWSTDGHTALTGYQPSRDAHDRHGFHPGLNPPPVHMYGLNATGRVLAEREAARRS